MQTTIYIRKDNEDHWNSIADKSAWVNNLLSKTAPRAQEPDHQPESLVEQATAIFKGKCTGHTMRMNCGLKGCKYT